MWQTTVSRIFVLKAEPVAQTAILSSKNRKTQIPTFYPRRTCEMEEYNPISNPYKGDMAKDYLRGFNVGVREGLAKTKWRLFDGLFGVITPTQHGFSNGWGIGHGNHINEYIVAEKI